MSRDIRDMIRFLSTSKGLLLGTSDLLGLDGMPWEEMRGRKWKKEEGMDKLVGEIESILPWLRAALTWLSHSGMQERDNEELSLACVTLIEKISNLLQDYGNNRRLKR